MNEHPLQSFIELVRFDQETFALEDSIQQKEKEIDLIEKTRKDVSSGSLHVANRMKDARKDVDQSELTMRELERQEQEEKARLDRVENQKEYQSVLREIESLKRRQHEYEKNLVVAWSKHEALKKEYEARQAEDERKTADLRAKAQERLQEVEALQDELEKRLQLRNEKKAGIPLEWLEKYVLMKSRVTNPVVPVINGSCTACFYGLPRQEFLTLSKQGLIQCKGCYRFLFIPVSQE